MLKKHKIYIGSYAEIEKHFKRVKPQYILNKTKYFEMPSRTIKEQLKELVENKQTMGMVSYCKVLEHKEDPIVELINDFIFIEDIFTVGNQWVEKNLMGQYRAWSNPNSINTTIQP